MVPTPLNNPPPTLTLALLEEEVKRIHEPIKDLDFRARYKEQEQIQVTGYWRDLWNVKVSSVAMNEVLGSGVGTTGAPGACAPVRTSAATVEDVQWKA